MVDHTEALARDLAAAKNPGAPSAPRWLVVRPPGTARTSIGAAGTAIDLSDPATADATALAPLVSSAVVIDAMEARLTDEKWRAELIRHMTSARDKPLIVMTEIDPVHWLRQSASAATAAPRIGRSFTCAWPMSALAQRPSRPAPRRRRRVRSAERLQVPREAWR
jgi:hypothetical protein